MNKSGLPRIAYKPCKYLALNVGDVVCMTPLEECLNPDLSCRFRLHMPVPRFEFVSYATDAQMKAGLPERKTEQAAGYDFAAPADVTIAPGEIVTFGTGIKAYMEPNTVLMLFPRSSMGIKRGIVLANGTGIIDADYADNPDNEGNITAALRNTSDSTQTIHAGERYMQGIFMPFLTVPRETVSEMRRGGIGSTDNGTTG